MKPAYNRVQGTEGGEYIKLSIRPDEERQAYVGNLSTGGPAMEGSDYVFTPAESMEVPHAIARGEALALKHGIPMLIQLEDGAQWQETWGDLND